MCMQFHVTRRDVAVFAAGCVVLSPILIPAGVIYGLGMGIAAAAGAIKNTHEESKATKQRFQSMVQADLASRTETEEFSRAAQQLYDAAEARPSFATLYELAVALFAHGDIIGAHETVVRALAYAEVDERRHATGLYLEGKCLQILRQFSEAIPFFEKALVLVGNAPPSAAPGDLTPADVAGGLAYTLYLNALHGTGSPTVDLPRALATADIAVTGAPTPFHSYLRGIIRYYSSFDPDENVPIYTDMMAKALDDVISAVPENDDTEQPTRYEALALAARCYWALKKYDEAETMDRLAKSCRFDADRERLCITRALAEKDPWAWRLRLSSRMPLPPSIADDCSLVPHAFKKHFFKSPTYCDYCMKFISLGENIAGAVRCYYCSYECHGGACAEAAGARVCLMRRGFQPTSAAGPHTHEFHTHRMGHLRNCIACNKSIMVATKAAQCRVCNGYAHEKCVAGLAGVGISTTK